jgi:hypothetical protein
MSYSLKISNRVYINIFVDKINKINKNSLVVKHRVYNEFMSHKVTYLLCLINEFRLYVWENVTTLKLNQFSLKIRFIVFQIKHILSRKVWLSFNEKNQNNISSRINLIFLRIILYKPW